MAEFDLVIIGAGPGGLKAAETAAKYSQKSVLVIDEQPGPGGQIWRRQKAGVSGFERAKKAGAEFWFSTSVVSSHERSLQVLRSGELVEIEWNRLILATGARELFLPFPGWTHPGVMGVGGLQAAMKDGVDLSGKRVVLAGTGPLLIAVGAMLARSGVQIEAIIEQVSEDRVREFGLKTVRGLDKALQAANYLKALRGVPRHHDSWVRSVKSSEQGLLVQTAGGISHEIECDFLGVGYGLVPNTELAESLYCCIKDQAVEVDGRMMTTRSGVYAVGEATGISGQGRAEEEGATAALSIIGLPTNELRECRVQTQMKESFALRQEVLELAEENTIVCRCEDVTLAQIEGCRDFREAKLAKRVGMGPCQGRICGAALRALKGWNLNQVRPPYIPIDLDQLAGRQEPE